MVANRIAASPGPHNQTFRFAPNSLATENDFLCETLWVYISFSTKTLLNHSAHRRSHDLVAELIHRFFYCCHRHAVNRPAASQRWRS